MRKKRLNILLDKYIAGTINATEKQELSDLYHDLSYRHAEFPDDREHVKDRMLLRLNNEILPEKRTRNFTRLRNIAAAVIIIITCGGIYMYNRPAAKREIIKPLAVKQAIVPEINVATLTLANGDTIVLNAAAKGKLAIQGNTVITKNAAGQISYEVTELPASNNTPVTYNTLTTPPGGQFMIILPDGSKVWLNAASSLKYPNRFAGAERRVTLTGEAYFEIFKNKDVPFTVSAENTNVKVLGTHFNVMAYQNETAVKTTLLEGAVSITANKIHKILAPGQQAIASKTTNNVSLHTVNTDDAIAWKNGYFSFRKENIRTAMNKVARWYNVDIEYRGNISNKTLGGSISRTENITTLLDYLALTGIATFKTEGRKVIVICK